MSKAFKTIFCILLFFTALQVNADISSEVGISISIEKTNAFLQQVSGDFQVDKEPLDFTGAGGLLEEVKQTGASVSLDSSVNFKLDGGDRVSAEIFFNELVLFIEGFEYEQITVIKRPGVTARVKTTIKCSELSMSLKDWEGMMAVSLEYKDGALVLNNDDGEFELSGDDLELDFSNCSAPLGVEAIFKEQILEWIRSQSGKDLLFEQALSYGQSFIDENWEKIKEKELSFKVLERTLNLELLSIDFFQGHLEARGRLKVLDDNYDYEVKLNEEGFERSKETSTVILPKELFSKVIPDLMKTTPFKFGLKRNEIPGVDTLFNSRLIQFFVWGDLLNFKKSVDFNAEISLFTQKAILNKKTDTGFSYSLKGRHRVDMDLLNVNGHPFPYMDFSGAVSSGVELSLDDEGVSFNVKSPSLSASSSFDPLMYEWRKSKPMGKPWMKMITPRISSALDNTVFNFSWEDMGLDEFIYNVELEHLDDEGVVLLNVGLKN